MRKANILFLKSAFFVKNIFFLSFVAYQEKSQAKARGTTQAKARGTSQAECRIFAFDFALTNYI